jgi:hypothetical protein
MVKVTSSCVIGLVFLTGCVSSSTPIGFAPGRYDSYRDLLETTAIETKFPQGTPEAVKKSYYRCAASFVLSGVSPTDLPKLDAYARGQMDLPISELNRINADIERKLGRPLTQGGLERLEPFCSADLPQIQNYPPYQ